jgi:hypothetical protein
MRLPTQPSQLNARGVGRGAFRRANAGVRPSAGEVVREMSPTQYADYTYNNVNLRLCNPNEQFCTGTGSLANRRKYVCCPKNTTCGTDNGRPYCRLIAPITAQLNRNTPGGLIPDVWRKVLYYIT